MYFYFTHSAKCVTVAIVAIALELEPVMVKLELANSVNVATLLWIEFIEKPPSELADTIDVKIAATDTACVSGVLRLYAVCLDISSQQTGRTEVDRDLV